MDNIISGTEFIVLDNVPKEVSDMEFSGKNTGFVINDGLAKFPLTEEIEVELTDTDIINHLDHVFCLSPDSVSLLSKNFNSGLDRISELFKTHLDLSVNVRDIYDTMPRVKDFLNMVSLGIIVGNGYTDVISYPYKMFYLPKNPNAQYCPFIRNTNLGRIYKSIPVMTDFTRNEFNNIMKKFYSRQLQEVSKKSNGDFFAYFEKTVPDENAVREIDNLDEDMANKLKDLELAVMLLEKKMSDAAISKVAKVVPKKRLNKIITIAGMVRRN